MSSIYHLLIFYWRNYMSLFICLEGLDGSGKSTQAKLLHEYFLSIGKNSKLACFPTHEGLGKTIRERLPNTFESEFQLKETENTFMALLNITNMFQEFFKKGGYSEHLCEDDSILICDRYFLSTLAYNVPVGHYTKEHSIINLISEKLLFPDIILYLDIHPDEALRRIEERGANIDKFETEEHLTMLSDRYQDLFETIENRELITSKRYDTFIIELTGNESSLELHEDIKTLIGI